MTTTELRFGGRCQHHLSILPCAMCLAEATEPTHKLTADGTVAVATDYFWQPIATCPRSVKVQLLGRGGVAIYGTYHGKDAFWRMWAPLPKVPKE